MADNLDLIEHTNLQELHEASPRNILKNFVERGGEADAVPGLTLPVADQKEKKQEKFKATFDDLVDQLVALRIDMQKVQAEKKPGKFVPHGQVTLDADVTVNGATVHKVKEVLKDNPSRYNYTISNNGGQTAYFGSTRRELDTLKQTLTAGSVITLEVQDSLWMYSPSGTTVDCWEIQYKTIGSRENLHQAMLENPFDDARE